MKTIDTGIDDVICFAPDVYGDERGFFMETFRKSWFNDLGIESDEFVQDNHSLSRKGILRGLHYQIKQPQGKLVRVVRGEVYDVAVDLREKSPTFGKWIGAYLSETNKHTLWVPPGFAHGFLVISHEAEFTYKCTQYYAPEHERSLKWDDPHLNIDWPLQNIEEIFLSAKDQNGLSWQQADKYQDL